MRRCSAIVMELDEFVAAPCDECALRVARLADDVRLPVVLLRQVVRGVSDQLALVDMSVTIPSNDAVPCTEIEVLVADPYLVMNRRISGVLIVILPVNRHIVVIREGNRRCRATDSTRCVARRLIEILRRIVHVPRAVVLFRRFPKGQGKVSFTHRHRIDRPLAIAVRIELIVPRIAAECRIHRRTETCVLHIFTIWNDVIIRIADNIRVRGKLPMITLAVGTRDVGSRACRRQVRELI